MFSQRFNRPIILTHHARRRMAERDMGETLLLELIENGVTRYKDEHRLWIAHCFPDRADNLLCVAAVIEESLIVKTVMHHFEWEGSS